MTEMRIDRIEKNSGYLHSATEVVRTSKEALDALYELAYSLKEEHWNRLDSTGELKTHTCRVFRSSSGTPTITWSKVRWRQASAPGKSRSWQLFAISKGAGDTFTRKSMGPMSARQEELFQIYEPKFAAIRTAIKKHRSAIVETQRALAATRKEFLDSQL